MILRNFVAELDWDAIARELDEFGVARTGPLLDDVACRAFRLLYDNDVRSAAASLPPMRPEFLDNSEALL